MWSFLALCVWMDGKDLVTCSYRTMRSCRDAGGDEKADVVFDESNQIRERSNPHSSELCTISQSSRRGRACIQIGLDILPFERSCNVVLMRSSTFFTHLVPPVPTSPLFGPNRNRIIHVCYATGSTPAIAFLIGLSTRERDREREEGRARETEENSKKESVRTRSRKNRASI
jgi:hypothetical protein